MKMYIFHKLIKAIINPRLAMLVMLDKIAIIFPDKLYLRFKFHLAMGKKMNLKNPKSFNEKLQWLKLYDRKPEYTQMVDKFEAKKYVAQIIGEEYIIPTLGIYDSVDEIDLNKLPDQFVLKCTHDSGGIAICKDKTQLNFEAVKKKLKKFQKRKYYYQSREWPYKNVKPRIIAEKYMIDESGYELKDYKFFCFDGIPKILFIASDRGSSTEETKFDFFDMNFNHLPITNGHKNSKKQINCPKTFEKMKYLATRLSKDIPHVRVDFYDIYGKVKFGELTFSHFGGMVPFEPEKWDYTLGEWIKLPQYKNII